MSSEIEPNREIEVTFIIRVRDTRPEEEREGVEQMVDAIAYGIDTDLLKGIDREKLVLADNTEIKSWTERAPTEPGELAREEKR